MITYEKMLEHINNMELDDDTLPKLQAAAEYYCSNYDLAYGFREAILFTLNDQYQNHRSEQEPDDLDKLLPYLI